MQKELILQGKTALGIEFGSTRIKAVLVDYDGNVLATGEHSWENSLIDGIWTYSLAEVNAGMRSAYSSLRRNVEEKYGVTPVTFGAMGVSAMMHGYIALDADDVQLAPFQTWRNTNTTAAADELTDLFQFNIPLRWSVAHLYQRMLDGEAHVEVLSGHSIKMNTWSHPYFHAGDVVRVKLCTMDEASYRYWKDYEALSTLSNNPFFPMTTNPTSNMVGAYGYWAGYGTDGIRVEIPASCY